MLNNVSILFKCYSREIHQKDVTFLLFKIIFSRSLNNLKSVLSQERYAETAEISSLVGICLFLLFLGKNC